MWIRRAIINSFMQLNYWIGILMKDWLTINCFLFFFLPSRSPLLISFFFSCSSSSLTFLILLPIAIYCPISSLFLSTSSNRLQFFFSLLQIVFFLLQIFFSLLQIAFSLFFKLLFLSLPSILSFIQFLIFVSALLHSLSLLLVHFHPSFVHFTFWKFSTL